MKIRINRIPAKTTTTVEVKTGSTVLDLLKKMKLKPDTVIVLNNKTPIPIDDVLTEGQELDILQVASGG